MRLAVVLSALTIASTASADEPTKGFPSVQMGSSFVAPHVQDDFLYAGYYQNVGVDTQGAGAMMLQGDPSVDHRDAHSLGEIGLSSADNQQIVEIGWHVDPILYKNDPNQNRLHLFVFHWVNGQPTCYNECGWVQTHATYRPGMLLTPGEVAEYKIQHKSTGWYISYKGEEMGYFPSSLWTTPYTAVHHAQWFGEVSAELPTSCSEMGNGVFGPDAGATNMSGLFLISTAGTKITANAVQGTVTNSAWYSLGNKTPTSFSFGGPGAPDAGACCTPESCSDFAQGVPACGIIQDRCGGSIRCGAVCDNGEACVAHLCGMPTSGSDAGPDQDGGVGDDAGVPDPDAGMGSGGGGNNGDEGGGCCDAGTGGAMLAWPSLLVGVSLLRRRRR